MNTLKAELHKLIEQMPDDASYEDVQYQIYVRQKIERGLAEVREGRVIDHEEVKRRVGSWQDESSGRK
jgi:predicted transcriptional regulator